MGSELVFIAPGSPWQNGKNERFNGIVSQELWGNLKLTQELGTAFQIQVAKSLLMQLFSCKSLTNRQVNLKGD